MAETIGKRIVANRKRLGLTQDQLAERLGVTAQAVSKWENDQSCPDISMLPKLAEIFGTSIDALLGCEQPREEKVYEAEVVTQAEEKEESEKEGLHYQKGNWEFHFDGGRKSGIGFALWVLLVGGLLLASSILERGLTLWQILWPSALLVGGLFGLFTKFSVFSLGCALFGGYFLLENWGLTPFSLSGKLIFPICLLLFGLSLLIDALRKPKKKRFSVSHNGKTYSPEEKKHRSNCRLEGESFECDTAFGGDTHYVDLPRLSRGEAGVSFGELTIDLTGVEEIAENCQIDANCAFGELRFLIPRRYRVEPNTSTAFASIDVKGSPDADSQGVIAMAANASFGQITIQYI